MWELLGLTSPIIPGIGWAIPSFRVMWLTCGRNIGRCPQGGRVSCEWGVKGEGEGKAKRQLSTQPFSTCAGRRGQSGNAGSLGSATDAVDMACGQTMRPGRPGDGQAPHDWEEIAPVLNPVHLGSGNMSEYVAEELAERDGPPGRAEGGAKYTGPRDILTICVIGLSPPHSAANKSFMVGSNTVRSSPPRSPNVASWAAHQEARGGGIAVRLP